MSPAKQIISNSGEPMLSARSAAKRMNCAQDYVGRLLRDGKLRGSQINGAWFVEEKSLGEFEAARAQAKLERASALAKERKLENETYRKANGLPAKKAVEADAVPSANGVASRFSSLLARNAVMALGGMLLFGAVAYAGAMHQREVAMQNQTTLAASLAQVESPFFGAHPLQFGFSLPAKSSPSVASDVFSQVFSFLFGPRVPAQYAAGTQTSPAYGPSAPVAAGTATTTIVQNSYPVYNTYPVTERLVQGSGVTEDILNLRLLALQNFLLPKIEAAALSPNPSHSHNGGGNSGGGNGSVTSVDASGGTTGLSFLGGPITSTGTFTLSGVLNAINGGTGTSTAPTYGQLLLGNSMGGYDLVSTSTLGIAAGGNPSWGNIVGTLSNQTDLQNALDSKLSLSAWYATTTDGLDEGATNLYFTPQNAQAYLDSIGKGYFFSTSSAAYFLSQNQGQAFSTTSAAYFLSLQSLSGFSTTSADYWKTARDFFSTTSSNYAVGAYISASSTVPHIGGGAFGDVLVWDGVKWAVTSTSTLGLGGSGGGSVTSVAANGGTTGLSFTGGPITSSGTLVLGGTLGVANGGTGTTTAPAYGQVLVGNATGGYDLVSTSSLGIMFGGTSTGFSTTSAEYWKSVSNFFSTTSTDYWKTQNNFFSTTSVAYFLAQNQGNAFSTTSAAYFLSQNQGNAFSTTSAEYWKSVSNFFSTTSASYFAAANGLLSTSSLSALAPLSYDGNTGVFSIAQANGSTNGYLSSSDWTLFNGKLGTTSISGSYPVQYNQTTGQFSLAFGTTTANAWSQLQQFNAASTSKLSVYQSASFGATATSTFSSTGALTLGGGLTLGSITGTTQCLRVNAAGVVSGTGSDCGTGGGGGSTTFLGLTDAPDTYVAGQIFFTNQAEDAVVGDNTFTFDGTTLNAPGAVFTTLTVLGSSNVGTVSTGVWHGSIVADAYVADNLTISNGTINSTPIGATTPSTAKFTNATSSSFFATSTRVLTSSTTLATIDSLYVSNLTGPLQAINGLVSATTSIGVVYGGTGLTLAPAYGQVLLGNSAGGYDLAPTSSLGFLTPASLSALAPLAYNSSTGIFTISQSGGSTDGYLSSTDWNSFNSRLSTSTLGLFDKGYFFSTTSAAYFLSQNQGNAFSTTSALYFLANNQNLAFSTTSADYWKTQNNFFSTTSAMWFVTSSTTIPKTYTANTFTNSNTFNGGVTISNLTGPLQAINGVVSATSSVGVLYGGTGLTAAPSYGNILVGNGTGGYALSATNTLGLLGSTSLSAGTGISYVPATGVISNTGVLSLSQTGGGTAQTGALTLSTSTLTQNGQTLGIRITNTGGAFTFAPTLSGTLDNAGLTNSTISGKQLGTSLSALSHNATLAGSSYDGSAGISDWGLNLSNSNTWAALQQFGAGLTAYSSSTISALTVTFGTTTNATSTSLYSAILGLNSEYFTDLTGSGLLNVGGALTLDRAGDWTGTLDGQEGSYYLANSFSTTSADYWKTQNNFFSTTSASYFLSVNQGQAFSTTSALYFLSQQTLVGFSTSSADYWKTQNNFFSTTSAIHFVDASSTIPKTYSSNTFTNSNTFNGGVTISNITGPLQAINGAVSATSTLSVIYGGTGLSTPPSYGNLLVGNSNGTYTLTSTSSLGLVTTGSLNATAPLFYNPSSGTFSIQDAKADGSTKGAASFASSDFNDNGAGLISIDYAGAQKANASQPGFLTNTDWSVFNNKISSTSLSGQSVISYTSSTGVITTQAGTFGGNSSSVYTFPGDVITSGTSTTTNLYINGRITGANLSSCSGSVDKLLWNSATGQFQCGTDAGASGSDVNWTHFNGSGIRLTTATDQVLIGFTSTSTLSKLEVVGGATIDNATTTGFYNSGIASFGGLAGFGTTSPSQKLTVAGGNILQVASGTPTLATSTLVGGTSYGINTSGHYSYVAAGNVRILDITQPGNPKLVGSYTGTTQAQSIVVSGKYAYVGDASAGLVIIDVSNPAVPTLVSTLSGAGHPISLALSGRYLYAPNLDTGMVNIVDIANPAAPVIVGQYSSPGTPIGSGSSVAVQGKYLYVGSIYNGSVTSVDISNPASPTAVYSYTGLSVPATLYASGRYLYVADASGGLYVLDISNPASISLAGSKTGTGYYTVEAAGDYAYVTDTSGNLVVLDVHNLASITSVGTFATGGNPRGLSLSGKYAYVTSNSSTVKVVDINGAKLPAANIGSLEVGVANIADNLNVGGDIYAQGGINVGISGIFSRGGLAVLGTTTLTDFVGRYSTTTTATTTGLAILGVRSALLTTNAQGSVVATSSLGVMYGGTGLSAAPSYGNILVGNSTGGYSLTATNTLGLLGSTSISATGPLSYNVSTGVFSISQSGGSTDGYLSSTDWNTFNSRLSTSTLALFDKGYFFSTTSANYWASTGGAFSTTSQDYYANAFRDWKIVGSGATAFLTPSSTVQSIGVFGSSTIGNGAAGGGLTVNGTATTTNLRVTSLTAGRVPFIGAGSQITDDSDFAFDSTNNTLTLNSVGANPTIYNQTSGNGVILKGDNVVGGGGQLRVVYNSGGWTGGGATATSTTYFQITNASNNNATFMGGTYGADTQLNRLQFNASSTQITDLNWTNTTVPISLFGLINSSAAKKVFTVQGASAQTADLAQFLNNAGTVLTRIDASGNFTTQQATTTNLAITSLLNTLLSTNANGSVISTTVSSPLSFSGNTLSIQQANGAQNGYLSSTDWTTFNNKISSTSLSATGPLSYNPSTGVFTISQSGASTDGYLSSSDWNSFNSRLSTTTLGLFDKGYFFSTTSALYFLAQNQGQAFSTTSAAYFLSVNQGNAFSTTSQNYYANTFRDWKIVAGALTPTTTLGIQVNASSTIGNGTLGLTVNGPATTTGRAYFSGNVGIGTSNPLAALQVSGGYGYFTSGITLNRDAHVTTNVDGSSDAGIYTPGGLNDLYLAVGSSNNVIAPAGNFGIGTTSPYSKLSVVGQVVAANYIATTSAQNVLPNLLSTNATTTSFGINNETFTDLTGSGLSNVGGVLTLDRTGDWTGTFDGQEGSYYLANSFSTTSAVYFLSQNQGNAFSTTSATYFLSLFDKGYFFSTTSADYWKTQNNFFSTTSASYFSSQGLAFSTTSENYYANAFRDWKIVNGALVPTTTLGIIVNASSTIGNGTLGLTVNGSATTTGNAYIAGNVGIGTQSPSARLDIQASYTTTGFPLSVKNPGYYNAYFQGTSASNQASFYLENDRGSFASYGGFLYGGSSSSLGSLFGAPRADRLFMFADGASNLGYYVGTLTAQPFVIGTNNIERARVDGNGNLGIGTTSPFARLSVGGNTYLGGSLTATGTVQLSNYANGALGVTSNGTLYTFSTSTWTFASSTLLADNNTFSGTNRFNGNTTLTNATSSSIYTSILGLNSEYFSDLTGSGLTNVGGALTLDRTGDWTGTLDGNEGSFYLANSFSTTSANYWQSQNNFFSTTSANYWASQGLAFSTTSENYYANAFRDWKIVAGALTPTTTIGIQVNASSTIGNGTQAGGLTIYGGATTTGNAYIAGNVGIGTNVPAEALQAARTSGITAISTIN
ncbi:MAG TPA: hypothetical protein VHD55_03845, partial [Candidatus Paceibacterota bacterium]|nr:hypothetical protein [Candidatus Paceibacterota bacterium]